MVLFSGCSLIKSEPKINKKEIIPKDLSKRVVQNVATSRVEPKSKKDVSVELFHKKEKVIPTEIIENVFSDELFFEKDKMHANKNLLVIKYLDALPWEKDALNLIYKRYKNIWSEKQSEEFKEILQEDKYLSLCGDKRYWDNLEFEEESAQKEVLHSILLLRYLNNLTNGCEKWVESNGKIKDENYQKKIDMNHVLSLLPHDVLIDKLMHMFLPHEKSFFPRLEEYKFLLNSTPDRSNLKEMRLEIERVKNMNKRPNYNKKEEK